MKKEEKPKRIVYSSAYEDDYRFKGKWEDWLKYIEQTGWNSNN